MKSIKDLPEVKSLSPNDEFLVSLENNGDRKVKLSSININTSNNNIFRGKNFGEIKSNNIDNFIADHGISTGEFKDIYIGDYFSINYEDKKRTVRIAGFNTFLNIGEEGDVLFNRNHVVCVFDNVVCNCTIKPPSQNRNNKTGYLGSDLWNDKLPDLNNKLSEIIGSHLLTYKELLTNSIDTNTGCSNGAEWVDCKLNIMSEIEVFGTGIYQSSGYDAGISRQLPLFVIEPKYIASNNWYYLRDVANSSNYCTVYKGIPRPASYTTHYVRPRFLLG